MSTVLFGPVVFLIVVLTVGVVVGVPLLLLWIATRNRHVPGPRFLGVCWRLAEKRGVAVGQVRMLAALAIILSGIVPGLLGYLLLAIFMEQWAGPQEMASPPLPPQRVADVRSPVAPRPFAGPERIGRYTVTGLIGRGGMGTVYRGHDDALDRDVAVKVIHDRFGHSENVLRRFGEEAKNVARLSSPHIVHVHEFDPLATPPFLAMELVRGPSLQQLIRGRGRASFATVLDCARQMLAGLATAHSAGIVHRDIKPANVLRGPDGTYKLTDFGLARSLEREQSLTATGSIIGTLHYMAPEVAAGEEATAASDLYIVGVTLYEMLAGTTPFPEESPLKLLRRIAAERPLPVTAHRDGIPPQLEAWLAKLLAHDPGSRPPPPSTPCGKSRFPQLPTTTTPRWPSRPRSATPMPSPRPRPGSMGSRPSRFPASRSIRSSARRCGSKPRVAASSATTPCSRSPANSTSIPGSSAGRSPTTGPRTRRRSRNSPRRRPPAGSAAGSPSRPCSSASSWSAG